MNHPNPTEIRKQLLGLGSKSAVLCRKTHTHTQLIGTTEIAIQIPAKGVSHKGIQPDTS